MLIPSKALKIIIFLLILILLILNYALGVLGTFWGGSQNETLPSLLYIFSALLNASSVFLFYGWIFDETSTHAGSWALGMLLVSNFLMMINIGYAHNGLNDTMLTLCLACILTILILFICNLRYPKFLFEKLDKKNQ